MTTGDARRAAQAPRGVQPGARPAMSVLFVDPDLVGAQRLADAINDRYAVAVVSSARQAWETMRRGLPNVVVTELDLPDTSGLELIRAIYATPATHNVYLLVVTARTGIRDKIAAFQAGADDFLVKPIEPSQFDMHLQLVARFRRVLGS
ncbi:MAG TPA: response regulator [Ktedonobacterales bacterium]|nr:response regulator [Ktedonobacterales bacterium]